MLKVRNELLEEIDDLGDMQEIDAGPAFMRLHVIDMEGPMDIEVGVLANDTHPGDDPASSRQVDTRHSRFATTPAKPTRVCSTGLATKASSWIGGRTYGRPFCMPLRGLRHGSSYSTPENLWELELTIRVADCGRRSPRHLALGAAR